VFVAKAYTLHVAGSPLATMLPKY